jgi:DNA-binding MarR family transcriptional regulator
MELEKEIFQKTFKSEHQKAVINIIFTYNWLISKIKKEFVDYDITMQQFNILRILRGQYPNPATVNLLKERMLDKMCDASRIVDRLKEKELIEKCVNKKDRRAADIIISQKGLDLLSTLDQKHDPTIALENLTPEESKLLNQLLDKMRG